MTIMDNLFNLSHDNELWTKRIERKITESSYEESFVNEMAYELLTSNKASILSMTFGIIEREINKRPNIDLRKKILIKNQVLTNMVENVTNMVLNLAKNFYDEYVLENQKVQPTQPELDLFDEMVLDNNMFVVID
jgi:hypothetical protein